MRFSGMKYFIPVLLILFLLTGCGVDEPAGTTAAAGGTVQIALDHVISIQYDSNGKVTSVWSDGSYDPIPPGADFAGKDVADVIVSVLEHLERQGKLDEEDTVHITVADYSGASANLSESISQTVADAVSDRNWNVDVQTVPQETLTQDLSQQPTHPQDGPTLPEGAQLQEDGSYILVQYVNAMNVEVEQNKAESLLTTVYDPDGKICSQQLQDIKTGVLRQSQTFTYENGVLYSATSQYFDKAGKFRLHYEEQFDLQGQLVKRVDYDKNGVPENIAEYSYFEGGNLRIEMLYYGDGTAKSMTEYDDENKILSAKKWYQNGALQEDSTYSNGVLYTQVFYNSKGEQTGYMEYWPNGNVKISQNVGFYYNGEHVPGKMLYEFYEDGTPSHDLALWPDGTVCSEFYYYPSGNIKSQHHNDPSNSYNPEFYGEYRDGALEPYTGWNVIDGEKVYFGAALQEQHPDRDYDENGNLLRYTVTENGHTYEVKKTYDSENRCITEEWLGKDGSRAYMEYGFGFAGWETLYSDRSGSLC